MERKQNYEGIILFLKIILENDSCTKYNKYEVLTLKMETLSTKQKSYNKISSLINDEERQKLKHL